MPEEIDNVVDASEVANVVVNGQGKIKGENFTYKGYIYPNGRPTGEAIIVKEHTREAFSVVVSSRFVDGSSYLGTTKGNKRIDSIFAPYTDYKINLVPMCSATSKTIVYYNPENLIDNLPNILGQVQFGVNVTREYYELYKELFNSAEGYVLYDADKKGYVYLGDVDYRGDTKLIYTENFNQNVITATSINVLKALLQSKYAEEITYPISVFKYTTDKDDKRVIDLDKAYGEFTSPKVFVSGDSLAATLSDQDISILKNKLLDQLALWGDHNLNRPNFGNECLWADSSQGVIYAFGLEYDDNLATDDYMGYKNEEYLSFFNNHPKDKPYLYIKDEYGTVDTIWSIEELKDIAKTEQDVQNKYLSNLLKQADKCKDAKDTIEFLKGLDYYDMPTVFPDNNFIIQKDNWEEFLKTALKTKLSDKEKAHVDKSNEPWPYTDYIEHK